VHVHHGLRGAEADGDLAFVEELCAGLEVPLHVRRASVPQRLAESAEGGRRETTEEAARAVRYACFRELIAGGHADAVLTAHTLDDQAETVLMKLLRGAWTEGLSGIHPVVAGEGQSTGQQDTAQQDTGQAGRATPPPAMPGPGGPRQGMILRPLLGIRRAALREFLETRAQAWREDATNADEAFTRNRIRHSVLPVLRMENPAIDQALANLAVLAREEEARWSAELARTLPQLLLPGRPVRGGGRATGAGAGDAGGGVAIELERLRALDPALRRRVLRAAARAVGGRLSFDETARLLELAGLAPGGIEAGRGTAPAKAARIGASLHLSGSLQAERSLRELRIYRVSTPLSGDH
jgi:tRNA(Ile)-lysidine synthase